MGGPVAIKLAEDDKAIKTIILVSAAAYAKEAENKSPGTPFTKTITRKNNWQNSTCFQILRNYKNPVMVIYSSKDSVIPEGVKNEYKRLLKKKDTYLVIKNGSHTLLNPKTEPEKKAFKELLNKSSAFLLKAFTEITK